MVAPSDPKIIYVGTGEQTTGNGVYKSTDAGATWTNIGLHETHVITSIVVDPRNPNVVLVAAAGDHWSRAERGVYKTSDSGKKWQKVLYKDEETGVFDIAADPDNPSVLYASMWTRPEDPFSTDEPEKKKTQDAAIFKSTDQGSTWSSVEGKGLPTEAMGRIGVAVAPGSNGKRVFAIVTQGLYRSEDGGATWQRSTSDPRILGNSYFSRVFVDPINADNVYVAQTSIYRSDRRRPQLRSLGRRAQWRRLSRPLDQSCKPAAHDPRSRPGRHHQRGWRQYLEFMVQPSRPGSFIT